MTREKVRPRSLRQRKKAQPRKENSNYDLRELRSVRFDNEEAPAKFRRFADKKLLPLVKIDRYKVEEKRRTATNCLRVLIAAELADACVADTRDTHKGGVRLRAEVWDAIIAAGLARCCRGSEASGKVTRYAATPKLLELRKCWRLESLVDLDLPRNTELSTPTKHALVVLKIGKRDPLTGKPTPMKLRGKLISIPEHVAAAAQKNRLGYPDPLAVDDGLSCWRRLEDMLERINRKNAGFSFQVVKKNSSFGKTRFVRPVNSCLRQIHIGELRRAARLHSWSALSGQLLPKRDRRKLRIGGERTAEFDYSCMAIGILYHQAGLEPAGDLYRAERVMPRYYKKGDCDGKAEVRNFIKRVTNICWNVHSPKEAIAATEKLLHTLPCRGFLREVMRSEDLTVADLVERIRAVHPKLRKKFFSGCGIELMSIDGEIMYRFLIEFVAKRGLPALAIHDGVVCRISDSQTAKSVMKKAYRKVVGYSPKIK